MTGILTSGLRERHLVLNPGNQSVRLLPIFAVAREQGRFGIGWTWAPGSQQAIPPVRGIFYYYLKLKCQEEDYDRVPCVASR